MRKATVAIIAALLVPAAALAAIQPGASTRISGPSFGTSGGDEPYLVALAPAASGAIAGYLTRLNLSDTPPGDFIIRPLDAEGVPVGKGVTYGEKDDIHVAAAVLDASGERGLAIWDDHPDGEDVDAGPIWVQRFKAKTAVPIGGAARIFKRTELHAAARLGDDYLMVHEPATGGDLLLQQLDPAGTVTAEAVALDFFGAETVSAADGESVLVYDTSSAGRVKAAIVGPDGFLLEPGRIEVKAIALTDVAAAPGGGWVLAQRGKDKVVRVQALSTDGELGAPAEVEAAGTRGVAAQIAFAGPRGLLVWPRRRACDGFSAVALRASGKPASDTASAVPAAPACGGNGVFDLELSATGPRRFVLGWTLSNGDAGHYVYSTLIRR